MRSKKGFTLPEMLVLLMTAVILTLALASVVMGAITKNRQSELIANLHRMREAVQRYEATCGDYPYYLEDIMRPKDDPIPQSTGGTGLALDPAGYEGPYLATKDGKLPKSPFHTDMTLGELTSTQELVAGYLYDHGTGEVWSATREYRAW